MCIEGRGYFFTLYFQVLYVLCFTRSRYQVSAYRTIGPLVSKVNVKKSTGVDNISAKILKACAPSFSHAVSSQTYHLLGASSPKGLNKPKLYLCTKRKIL